MSRFTISSLAEVLIMVLHLIRLQRAQLAVNIIVCLIGVIACNHIALRYQLASAATESTPSHIPTTSCSLQCLLFTVIALEPVALNLPCFDAYYF
jgi:hypothetical protein